MIQQRLEWRPRRALVLGAGQIGLLATLTLRMLGWDVVTAARKARGSRKALIAEQSGAQYHSVADTPILELARQGERFDLIFEATGSSEAAFNSIHALAANGVLCLTSVTGGSLAKPLPIDRINCDLVLGNKLVFGTVNAGRADFSEGLSFMKPVEKSYPGTLSLILTGRITFEHADRMFEIQKNGIKTVFEVFSAV